MMVLIGKESEGEHGRESYMMLRQGDEGVDGREAG